MKFNHLLSAFAIGAMATLLSCQKENDIVVKDQVSEQVLGKIRQLGFSTENVQRIEEGYLVEGDMVLTEADLNTTPDEKVLRAGTEEQYRTNNLVNVGSGRTITVSISNKLPSSYVAALDEAISRYNAENLSINFRRVNSNANISIIRGSGSYLASAGFPSNGNPYSQVKVNSAYIGSRPNTSYLATILAHELGHCIGFRHTDYMDRSYSCGGQYANEGASTVGAVHIPGTPTDADAGSWMLACIGTGVNRYFNNNDKTALNYLY